MTFLMERTGRKKKKQSGLMGSLQQKGTEFGTAEFVEV